MYIVCTTDNEVQVFTPSHVGLVAYSHVYASMTLKCEDTIGHCTVVQVLAYTNTLAQCHVT